MTQNKEFFNQQHIAQKLGIQTYMLSAWEKKFTIEPVLKDGEKWYTQEHLATFSSIKELLYDKGLSMDAARTYLHNRSEIEEKTLQVASTLVFSPAKQGSSPTQEPNKKVVQTLLSLKDRLLKLRNSLES